MKTSLQVINGWIALDKPSGITSAQAVAKVKHIVKPKKIGHAGTLDPLASGVLPLALGEATKTVEFMMDACKAYGFTVKWGEERDTDDSQGQVTATSPRRPSEAEIRATLTGFTGAIQQTPPDYSAIKIGGVRAYDAAREGDKLELKARTVQVHSLELLTYNEESSEFFCECGKGTYIRSIARDMGRLLGCYGHITVLRRLKVGKFTKNNAISLASLEEMVHKGGGFLLPVESALDDILALHIDSNQTAMLRHGQFLPSQPNLPETVLALHEGKPVAICKTALGVIKPVKVFNLP